jgi:hypothetical protein
MCPSVNRDVHLYIEKKIALEFQKETGNKTVFHIPKHIYIYI